MSIDCREPRALAEFWMAALGYRPADPPPGYSSRDEWFEALGVPRDEWHLAAWIVDPDGVGPSIHLQGVPEPKVVKNRLHFDVDVTDRFGTPLDRRKAEIAAEAERLVALGATRVEEHVFGDRYHVVMTDPEGNEFCLR
ncbi:MAG TPA: VOC family protein [Actinomycetota bacterium]|nr:VOC family protein [Actinomycetota bacterium]